MIHQEINTIGISDAKKLSGKIETIILRAYDPIIYLVDIITEGKTLTVCKDNTCRPISFPSQVHAKKEFKGMGIKSAFLMHESAYDEVIGFNHAKPEPMKVSISAPDEDYS